jgi:hypothetical protein
VAHPLTNGQAERANNMILQGLKSQIYERLKKFAGQWAAKVPSVLWSLRTSLNRSTGFMPFFMVFGSEAVLQTELEYGTRRIAGYNEDRSKQARQDTVDQLDEARDIAVLRSTKYQQTLRRYYGRKVQQRALQVGDLVLQRVQTNKEKHKLTPRGRDRM